MNNKKHPWGRPTKKTPDNVGKLLQCIQSGMSRSSACAHVGLAWNTVQDWMTDDKEFLQKIRDAEEFWLGIVENQKNKLINKAFRPAIEKELKSKRASVYGDKSEVKQEVTIQANFSEMTDDELKEFLRKQGL